ncbi:hypothetical protein [Dawidia soli]|uniref:Uncharacterized protein n=1 Tax=Dawidia soli TaxID=2782352 RepID=A0AAP2DBY8_9BACT|nr:hypothetical protein [Dawidia soli]MBT1689223.1 hypothetical protein [Dawidia soli]
MEHFIRRAGGPLPALRQVIETDVGKSIFYQVTQQDAAADASLLDTVTEGLGEFFDHLFPALHRAYHEQPDEPAQRRYLAECQRTLLRLAGHLLQYTQPVHLYATLSRRGFRDVCCHQIYRALDRLLRYTVELADGQIDPTLPLLDATRTVLQGHLVSDLVALREHLARRHVSPKLIGIVLAPFEALPRTATVTFYMLYYLRTLKEALLHGPLPGHETTGDESVLELLAAYNFNAPELIAYCRRIVNNQLETCRSYEARLAQLYDYQVALATLPRLTPPGMVAAPTQRARTAHGLADAPAKRTGARASSKRWQESARPGRR